MSEGKKTLRSGFSTGTAATAAALGAVQYLAYGQPPDKVEPRLPGGQIYPIKLFEAHKDGPGFTGVKTIVIKDAGDDPDVTNQAKIGVVANFTDKPGLVLTGGAGVGKITKAGLVLPPGEWAINPVPRLMLKENLAPFLSQSDSGLAIEIFILKGEELAQRTLNPRLGILGGLSILGTTGLVKPFSHEAYIATIDSALSIAKAAGLTEIVLTTGGRSEKFAQKERSDLPPDAFVQIADFFAEALKLAVKYNFETIGLAVFFGKAIKQASGLSCTHSHKSEMDLSPLGQWLPDIPSELKENLINSPTALAALELLKEHKAQDQISLIAEKLVNSTRTFTGSNPKLWATIFDFDGTILASTKA